MTPLAARSLGTWTLGAPDPDHWQELKAQLLRQNGGCTVAELVEAVRCQTPRAVVEEQ